MEVFDSLLAFRRAWERDHAIIPNEYDCIVCSVHGTECKGFVLALFDSMRHIWLRFGKVNASNILRLMRDTAKAQGFATSRFDVENFNIETPNLTWRFQFMRNHTVRKVVSVKMSWYDEAEEEKTVEVQITPVKRCGGGIE